MKRTVVQKIISAMLAVMLLFSCISDTVFAQDCTKPTEEADLAGEVYEPTEPTEETAEPVTEATAPLELPTE